MTTLLLQCVAPLQSWGTQSEYIVRDTGREPSKSGIIGLLCAAMGIPRDDLETIAQLAKLEMGVRVDREGKILRDYHTITHKLKDKKKKPSTVVSTRYYLSDAMFLVGLEGDKTLLEKVQAGLHHPKWNLFLGRKSCPPSRPPYLKDGLSELPLHQAMKEYPWLGQSHSAYESLQRLRFVFDDVENGNEFHHDVPVNFQRNQRKFHPRRTRTRFIKGLPEFEPEKSYPLVGKAQEISP